MSEIRSKQADDAKSVASKAPSVAASVRSKNTQQEEEEKEAYMKEIRAKYQPILTDKKDAYKPKMVGLNPKMRGNESKSKIFPMQGLWSNKQLFKSNQQHVGVPLEEQMQHCKETEKGHFKKMYEQKEYMEEYLKFKEVIAGMKK